jgi:hypothetical protein
MIVIVDFESDGRGRFQVLSRRSLWETAKAHKNLRIAGKSYPVTGREGP